MIFSHPRLYTIRLTPLFPLALLSLAAAELKAALPVLSKKVDFETEVLPIFKRNCLACHDGANAEADLVLETPKMILQGGESGPVVVPRHSEKSLLLKTTAQESKPFMPPKNNKVGAEALKPEELAVLKAWIDQGATGTVNAKPKPVVWQPLPPGLHPILALAVTGDGQFAACGRANQIFIYHLPTGQIVARLTDPKLESKSAQRDFVQSLAFSPDGRTLASGEYRMVKLWQREPKVPQFSLGGAAVSALAASPDGKWFATAGADHVIRLWDAATGKAVKELPGHTAAVNSVKFSPDSSKLASASTDKSLRIWDLAAGKLFAQTETAHEVSTVAWIRGGKQLATGGDNAIHLWELPAAADAALKPLKELAGHTQPVTSLDASPDGKQLLSGSRDGSVRHWAVEQSRQVRQLDHGAPVTSVAVSPNGKTFASAGGNVAKLWSADKGQMLGEMKGDHAARAKIAQSERASAFAKNEVAYGKTTLETALKTQSAKAEAVQKATEKVRKAAQLAAKQADQSVIEAKAAADQASAAQQQADAAIVAAKNALAASEAPIRAIAFAPDSLTVATAGDDPMIRTWSAADGAGFETYPSQPGPLSRIAYTADGRLIAAALDQGVVVWRTAANWTLARTIGSGDLKSPLTNRVLTLDFSADGQWLATGGGIPSRSGELKIWRAGDGSLVREIKPSHSDTVFGLAFSPDGKALASASADKLVKIFDTASGKLIKSLSGHTHYALSVGWRADGRALVSSGADAAVKLWTYPAGEQTKTIEGFKKEVTAVRFLGSEILAASGDAKVRLIKEDGGALRDFAGQKGFIFSIGATPDGQTILGGGQDSVLRLWKASTGKILLNLEPPPAESAPKSVGQTEKK